MPRGVNFADWPGVRPSIGEVFPTLHLRFGLADPVTVEIRSLTPIRHHIGGDVAIPWAVQQEYCHAGQFSPSTDDVARLGSPAPLKSHNRALRKGNRARLLLVNLPGASPACGGSGEGAGHAPFA